MNADLLKLGHSIRDLDNPEADFYLTDLYSIIVTAERTSAMYRAVNPRDSQWDTTSMLLASMLEHMTMRAWVEGEKKGKKPERITRPGVEDKKTASTERRKADTMTIDEIDAWMSSRRA